MNNTSISKRYLVRLVIETQSPMAINSGDRETAFDAQLARDNNGLPTIPATAIAGVWQSVANALAITGREAWFGFINHRDKENNSYSQRSALTISNGLIHNSKNTPIMGIQSQAELQKDPLLALLLQARPHHRERVSLNDRGVAKDTGKFDQLLLPKGCRFSINIQFDDQFVDENAFHALLECWQSRSFALGSSTRNGLGRINVIASEQTCFNLNDGAKAGHALQKALCNNKPPQTPTINITYDQNTFLKAHLPLKALDNWRCGAGSALLQKNEKTETNKSEHSVNIMTYSEPVIEWTNQHASIKEKQAVLCGSSIKGILAHRIAFHYRKHTSQWAEKLADEKNEKWEERPEALSQLFGFADEKNHSNSIAGMLFVDDCKINDSKTITRTHNSIDRFTGGVRKGALYSEELLYQPEFTLTLWLDKRASISPSLKLALTDTLDDLKIGLLPMGAGSGRGNSLVMQKENSDWQTSEFDNINITEQAS
ncbi:RAMP superfamily CRISPR-associated protein [Psychromonas arctica]|uniref:RAMP superfamily CRISPR-associated protein n=1 Tax=Psychromonas arctica TaxID=168275 RepID=UPI002FD748D2